MVPATNRARATLCSHGSSAAGLPVLLAKAAAAFWRCEGLSMRSTHATAAS